MTNIVRMEVQLERDQPAAELIQRDARVLGVVHLAEQQPEPEVEDHVAQQQSELRLADL